ncbi:hypothetical protein FQN49_000694 [Arthroderma sp. PD_2]|nr:hypothetical protein FQN49_000694 [Arthroderma sp. PD_2]
MLGSTQDGSSQDSEPLLDYGCSHWRISSQRSADLYRSGAKLWRKEDLVDIEQQLAQSQITEKFTVRRIDGSVIHIKNPMFGVSKPIWKPYVKFREYWNLVRAKPDADQPSEIYSCTYLVDWTNRTKRDYDGPIVNAQSLFEDHKNRWNASATCEAFTSQFRKLLDGVESAKVIKIICFGLGDLNLKPPDWWKIENNSQPKDKQELETSEIEGAFIHHAIALTMANVARSCAEAKGIKVRLLTQDPAYTNETKSMLQETGFEVIGEYGAGGFAELDDTSIVFSPFTNAPVKQIIADLSRPAVIISARGSIVFNKNLKPYADPDSPRTRQMWAEYNSWGFPVDHESEQLKHWLHPLVVHAKVKE